MAFVDEITLHLKAGDGGNGIVSWLHEKGKEYGGPAGGDGGNGGDIYAKGIRDVGRLAAYKFGSVFRAERGANGRGRSWHGKSGQDLDIELPIGSVITNLQNERTYEILKDGERILLLRGGKGGYGNEHFKGSHNVRPMESSPGKIGQEADFHVELRLIADAGFIGLPNAGKSSILNALTRAGVKVGSYAFTTLEPSLGSFNGFILADIPGLIEGASEGRGLGHKFLRHIRRTAVIFHCISLEQEDLLETYGVVRKELEAYAPELLEKEEVIILTKTDAVTEKQAEAARKAFKKKKKETLLVSIIDDARMKQFKQELLKLLKAA